MSALVFSFTQEIDIEYLKNGHEIFKCSTCNFQSNDTETVKNHLAEHVLQPKVTVELNSKSMKDKKAMLKSSDWRDMFDYDGNPLCESDC